MEPTLPFSVESGVKEEQDPIASASSSSRLSNLSSSSRRLRHISPPPSSRLGSQRNGIGTGQAQSTPQKFTNSEAFHSITSTSPAVSTDVVQRTSAQTAGGVTHAYNAIRGIVFLWKWFCFGYFCVTILVKFRHFTVWRNSRSVEFNGLLSMQVATALNNPGTDNYINRRSRVYSFHSSR